MHERTAKIFRNGRSQAVRLPKEFRFEGQEVRIRQVGRKVILEPLDDEGWGEEFWAVFGQFGDDFDLGDRHADQERELGFP